MSYQEKTFRGAVDRVTGRGRAIVETDDIIGYNEQQLPGSPSEINLGEVPQEVRETIIGEIVNFVYGGGNYGMLIEEKWITAEYITQMEGRVEVDLQNIPRFVEPGGDQNLDENPPLDVYNNEPENPKNRLSSKQSEATSFEPDSSTDISELRRQAVESAVEEVPEDALSSQHQTHNYNRSQEVKEYVKARAGGVCEGCGEPAPFTSKTGEPYLHAHHIHELSGGGSDSPDTVVALCPNCHYRVHHGTDGDEYNQELLETIQNIENKK